jgi:hypothetical protein
LRHFEHHWSFHLFFNTYLLQMLRRRDESISLHLRAMLILVKKLLIKIPYIIAVVARTGKGILILFDRQLVQAK